MDIHSLLNSAKSTASNFYSSASELVEATTNSLGSGLGYAKQSLSNSWLFGSSEVAVTDFDEKHYFLIPFKLSEQGYSLYSMRCLPEGVPPINDLPKKRLFHLPNEHAAKMVETLLRDEAADTARKSATCSTTATRLADLADQIDKLDQTAFNGALLIGGLVALANPVAGGILAAKAMVPSIGLLLTKYGLKQAGETFDQRTLASQIKSAEKKVLAEFHGKQASQVVEPLLGELDKAINTSVYEYDPVLEGSTIDAANKIQSLAIKAITNTYQETLNTPKSWDAAGLGPEDIRWLKMLQTVANI